MYFLVVLMLLFMLAYCLAQTYRDVRRRNWIFVAFGSGMILSIGWIIEAMTRGSSY